MIENTGLYVLLWLAITRICLRGWRDQRLRPGPRAGGFIKAQFQQYAVRFGWSNYGASRSPRWRHFEIRPVR